MKRLLLFNPSNDLALAANVRQYFPPRTVLRMENDLSRFPLVWAQDGDVLLCDVEKDLSYGDLQHRFGEVFIPMPWGWSLATKQRYQQFGVPEDLLPSDEQLMCWRQLSSREFAARYLKDWMDQLHHPSRFVDNRVRVLHHPSELHDLTGFPLVFKTLWSSSGRGLMVVQQWNDMIQAKVTAMMSKHGGILVDHFYEKTLDFAMEFLVEQTGEVRFAGYSVFEASEDGRYGGNSIAAQLDLEQEILRHLPFDDAMSVLSEMKSLHASLLAKHLSGIYHGYVGIDMMVCGEESTKIHPCVEINLRMNMGVAAIHLYEHLCHTGQLQLLDEKVCLPLEDLFQNLYLRKNEKKPFFDRNGLLPDFNPSSLSSMRLPSASRRDRGFQALLKSGKLVFTVS